MMNTLIALWIAPWGTGEAFGGAVAGLALGLDIDSIANHVRAYAADLRTKDDS